MAASTINDPSGFSTAAVSGVDGSFKKKLERDRLQRREIMDRMERLSVTKKLPASASATHDRTNEHATHLSPTLTASFSLSASPPQCADPSLVHPGGSDRPASPLVQPLDDDQAKSSSVSPEIAAVLGLRPNNPETSLQSPSDDPATPQSALRSQSAVLHPAGAPQHWPSRLHDPRERMQDAFFHEKSLPVQRSVTPHYLGTSVVKTASQNASPLRNSVPVQAGDRWQLLPAPSIPRKVQTIRDPAVWAKYSHGDGHVVELGAGGDVFLMRSPSKSVVGGRYGGSLPVAAWRHYEGENQQLDRRYTERTPAPDSIYVAQPSTTINRTPCPTTGDSNASLDADTRGISRYSDRNEQLSLLPRQAKPVLNRPPLPESITPAGYTMGMSRCEQPAGIYEPIQILPFVIVGSNQTAEAHKNNALLSLNITSLLNCCSCNFEPPAAFPYTQCALDDADTSLSLQRQKAMDLISTTRQDGGVVLLFQVEDDVSQAFSAAQTGAVCIMYLMWECRLTLFKAYALVHFKIPGLKIAPRICAYLLHYEAILHGSNSMRLEDGLLSEILPQ